MDVTLIQRPGELSLGRKTILLEQGRGPQQIGYYWYREPRRIAYIKHIEADLPAAIAAEVARLEGLAEPPKTIVPLPTPPEWLEEAEEPSRPIIP